MAIRKKRPYVKYAAPSSSNKENFEGEGNWAISYADLLMVLMSFFVIFFSTTDSSQESILQKIKLTLNKGTTRPGGIGIGDKAGAGTGQGTLYKQSLNKELADKLEKGFSRFNFHVKNTPSAILLELPPSIYPPRGFTLTPEVKDMIDKLTTVLLPYKNQLQLQIIGHADSAALKRTNVYLQDNFILSTLRAGGVAKHFINEGFSSKQIRIGGAADNERNTRSVSIEINPINQYKEQAQ